MLLSRGQSSLETSTPSPQRAVLGQEAADLGKNRWPVRRLTSVIDDQSTQLPPVCSETSRTTANNFSGATSTKGTHNTAMLGKVEHKLDDQFKGSENKCKSRCFWGFGHLLPKSAGCVGFALFVRNKLVIYYRSQPGRLVIYFYRSQPAKCSSVLPKSSTFSLSFSKHSGDGSPFVGGSI